MSRLPAVTPHPWHTLDHHVPGGGFRNIQPDVRAVSTRQGLTWFIGHVVARKENRLPRVRPVDRERLRRRPESVRMTWIGHSTMLLQTRARNILIDPIFSSRASPLPFAGPKREPALPLQPADLPEVHTVVLSHDHYDHFDASTLKRLISDHGPIFLAPLGVSRYLRAWGSDKVLEMDWWQHTELDGIRYHCLPARHFSGRSLTNRNGTLWASWYLEGMGGVDVYYSGDTAYAEHFGLIRDRIGRPDAALLPIGAYRPPWLMQPVHTDPGEAVQAFRDLEAGHFIPVHWGTFDLAEEPLHEPADLLRRLVRENGLGEAVRLLDIGESWSLTP